MSEHPGLSERDEVLASSSGPSAYKDALLAIEHVSYSYPAMRVLNKKGQPAVDVDGHLPAEEPWALLDINLRVEQGEYVALLGQNGSGKSTLARHCNALLVPDE